MIIQNINVVITGFKVKFKHKIIRWKVNGRVSYVLKLEFFLPNVIIHMTEVQNQHLFPSTLNRDGYRVNAWGGLGTSKIEPEIRSS